MEKVVTFEYPNMTARVHIPKLTKEERDKRLKEIKKAAAALLRKEETYGK